MLIMSDEACSPILANSLVAIITRCRLHNNQRIPSALTSPRIQGRLGKLLYLVVNIFMIVRYVYKIFKQSTCDLRRLWDMLDSNQCGFHNDFTDRPFRPLRQYPICLFRLIHLHPLNYCLLIWSRGKIPTIRAVGFEPTYCRNGQKRAMSIWQYSKRFSML